MELCDLCRTPSGRYNAFRECCQVRLLSTMPQQHRQQAYDRVRQQQGVVAERTLRDKVKAEYQRRSKAAIQQLKNIVGAAVA